MTEINELINGKAKELVDICKEKNVTVGFAESLTGGMISASVVNIPGASAVFKGSVVSYTNEIKENVLGVPSGIIREHTEVSEECALAMACGGAKVLDCDLVISVTGIAGPTGALPGKPVGTVYMGCCYESPDTFGVYSSAFRLNLEGDRVTIRTETVISALELAIKLVKEGKA